MKPLSRRQVLQSLGGLALPVRHRAAASPSFARPTTLAAGSAPALLPLTSATGLELPPPGRTFMNFSFDYPEHSLAIGPYLFSFRLITGENTYAMDPLECRVSQEGGETRLECNRLLWAGGQERSGGKLRARFRSGDGAVTWMVEAEHDRKIKSLVSIVRRVPRGRLNPSGQGFLDPGGDELLFEYPRGTWSQGAAATRQLSFPMLLLQQDGGEVLLLDCLDTRVRPKRFFFQPVSEGGARSYRVECIVEQSATLQGREFTAPWFRISRQAGSWQAITLHQEHFERAFGVRRWEQRTDVPEWLRGISLVLALHGMHWTGFVFNTFSRMETILEWVASRIDPRRVLVFLPAWDGRYYWDYGVYAEPAARMGGAEGLRRLIGRGHQQGFRFMPMFGANAFNGLQPAFQGVAPGHARHLDGNWRYIDNADWDNDRQGEGWDHFMNLGSPEWRKFLAERISDTARRFGVDAYFLDIVAGYINDPRYDVADGTRQLIAELRDRHPALLPVGEYYHDAQFAYIPLFQAFSERGDPELSERYIRNFSHLSHPAPGRGSSGVHELGFQGFDTEDAGIRPRNIATLTVVDDTFDRYRGIMEKVLERARRSAASPIP